MTKKYNFNDNFEMLYLRHEYLDRIENPQDIDISKYQGISATTAKLMYDKFRTNFDKVGFEADDLISITNVYLVAYLGLYSIRVNKEGMARFVEKFQIKNGENTMPTDEDIDRKDRNNLINFLRQRLHHCSTLCARKARNILIGRDFKGAFAATENSRPAAQEEIAADYKKYGYRKVTKKELKEAKIRSKEQGLRDILDEKGFLITEVEILTQGFWNIEAFNPNKEYDGHRTITHSDQARLFGENRGIFHNDPETALMNHEEDVDLVNFRTIFFKLSPKEKVRKLEFFIRKHSKNPKYKEEIKLAKNFLLHFKKRGKIIDGYESK